MPDRRGVTAVQVKPVHKRISLVAGLLMLAIIGSAMVTMAQSGSRGETLTACIDSRNGALYGAVVDSDTARCNRGDEQVSWTLGEFPTWDPPDDSSPGQPPANPGPGGSDKWIFVGSWQPNILYLQGSVVEYEGSSYLVTAENSQQQPPTDDSFWHLIAARGEDGQDGEQGPQGESGEPGAPGQEGERGLTGQQGPFGLDGEGFSWQGEYDPANSPYERNDVVQHEGSAWIATGDSTTGEPGSSGSEWELFAAGGVPDDNGGDAPGGSGIYRLTEIIPGTELSGNHVHVEASCPEIAPHVIGGGFQIVTSDEEPFHPASSQIDQLRGSGPIVNPEGPDVWRVSWFTSTGNIGTNFMKIDITCTDAVNDL
jgi:hypothetical protein